MPRTCVIGSRGSELAMRQSAFLQQALRDKGIDAAIRVIKTRGDHIQDRNLDQVEGKGFFTKEIEDALRTHETDLAVHSHKDLPVEPAPQLITAAVSERADPSELLLIRHEAVDESMLFGLKQHAVVGTSSARRKAQMQMFRPDVQLADMRGNVPTRIQKLREGHCDALLLAAAGVQRLALPLDDLFTMRIPPAVFIPAPAQGVLAFQCREEDRAMREVLAEMHDGATADCIMPERALMHLFRGGCQVPVGAYCEKIQGEYRFWACSALHTGGTLRRIFIRSNDAGQLAKDAFDRLQSVATGKVFITTDADPGAVFLRVLRAKGYACEAKSLVHMQKMPFASVPDCDWLFFSSRNAAAFFFNRHPELPAGVRFASLGGGAETAIRTAGHPVDFCGDGNPASTAARFLKEHGGSRVVMPQAVHPRKELSALLQQGCSVTGLTVYVNTPLHNVQIERPDVIVFTSYMQGDAYMSANAVDASQTVIAIGEGTARYFENKGISSVLVPPFPNFLSVADLICGLP